MARRHPEALKLEAARLQGEGMTFKAIGLAVGVPVSTILYWLSTAKRDQLAYKKRNKESFREYNRRLEATPEARERRRAYRSQNKEKFAYYCAARRARKTKSSPPWLTREHRRVIRGFYTEAERLKRETGNDYQVDHIHPLVGKRDFEGRMMQVSCGLHVPWNLEVVPGDQNRAKSCFL
jgi:hypothetical protein